jgi:hypothetical protein
MDANSDTILIPFNKKKIKRIVIFCIIGLCVSVWAFTIADSQTNFKPDTLKIYSGSGMIFFGLFLIYEVYTLFFDKRAGLVIDAEGINDNTSAVGSKSMKWNEITRFEPGKDFGATYIKVFVKDADEIMKDESVVQIVIRKSDSAYYGTSFLISSALLDCDFDELLKILNGRLEKYGKSKPITT